MRDRTIFAVIGATRYGSTFGRHLDGPSTTEMQRIFFSPSHGSRHDDTGVNEAASGGRFATLSASSRALEGPDLTRSPPPEP